MGRDGSLYEIAQWYPRAAVYYDVRGRNLEPYLGQGEFYHDFGNYDLAITVPAGYIVAATGSLQNASAVLPPSVVKRHAIAATSDTLVRLITADELASGVARPARTGTQTGTETGSETGTLTGRLSAANVRDAVWAASPDFQWDAMSWRGNMAYATIARVPPKTGTMPPISRACRSPNIRSAGSCIRGRACQRWRAR